MDQDQGLSQFKTDGGNHAKSLEDARTVVGTYNVYVMTTRCKLPSLGSGANTALLLNIARYWLAVVTSAPSRCCCHSSTPSPTSPWATPRPRASHSFHTRGIQHGGPPYFPFSHAAINVSSRPLAIVHPACRAEQPRAVHCSLIHVLVIYMGSFSLLILNLYIWLKIL
jgi:hypothetical protein